MKVSVLIPAYNCAATIEATLDSVLHQTTPANEILVMNDGSTDDTAAILKAYEPRVKLFCQHNAGVSSALNELIARAQGDLIAILGSDDLWHPRYLQAQRELFRSYPMASALFVDHANFCGLGPYDWGSTSADTELHVEILGPIEFVSRFRTAPGPFVMSFGCVPKRVLEGIGTEPFKLRESEDVYFCNLLPFWGPVVFATGPLLAAYRIREGSLASNRLKCAKGDVDACALLEAIYRDAEDAGLVREFEKTAATKRRAYAKILLGLGRVPEAREQLRRSLTQCSDPTSLAKSLRLLSLSYLPASLQPSWPSVERQWNPSDRA